MSSACTRSAQRSSTSSMPTDIRTRPSGMVGGLGPPPPPALERRLDAAQRGGVHPQPGRAHSRSAASAPLGEHDRDDRRRSRGSGPRRSAGAGAAAAASSAALAWARSTRRCSVRMPRRASQASKAPGTLPVSERRSSSTSWSCVVGGHDRAEQDVAVTGEVLRGRVHHDVGAQRERLLQQRGGEGVVDDDVGAGLVGGGSDGRRCRRSPAPGWSGTRATPARRRRRRPRRPRCPRCRPGGRAADRATPGRPAAITLPL